MKSDSRTEWKNAIVFLLASIILITLFSCSSFLYENNPWSDANIFVTMGRGVVEGKRMYTDLFDHKGPVLYFLFALAALISEKSFFGVYVLEIAALFLFFLYSGKILKLISDQDHTVGILLLGIIIVTCRAFSFGGGSFEEYALCMLQICNYIVLRRFLSKEDFTIRDCIVLGLITGMLFLSKFTMSGFSFGMGLVLVVYQFRRDRKKGWKCTAAVLLSFLAVFLLCLVCFVANHNVSDFFQSYFVFNLTAYPSTEGILSRLVGMVHAFLFYCKENLFLAAISGLGFLSALIHAMKKKQRFVFWYLLTVFLAWYIVSFIGGRYIAYYILPVSVWSIFLLQGLEGIRNRKAGMLVLILLSVCSVALSRNIRLLARRNTVQKQFADIMYSYDDNPSVMMDQSYDEGFYLAVHEIPACRFYTRINAADNAIQKEAESCIETAKPEFLVSMNTELENKDYVLLKTAEQEYDGKIRTYYLYLRKDLQ